MNHERIALDRLQTRRMNAGAVTPLSKMNASRRRASRDDVLRAFPRKKSDSRGEAV